MRWVENHRGKDIINTADGKQLVAMYMHSVILLERIGIPDVLGVLGELNAYAAELAALRATKEDLAVLNRSLERITMSEDSEGIEAALTEFVHGFVAASHNPLIKALCKFLV